MPFEPPGSVAALLERTAVRFPERGIAVFDRRARRSVRRTYPEVLAAARQAAEKWAALGVSEGDRVLVSLPMSWQWLDAWLGAVLRGALPVAVAPGAALGAAEAHVHKVEGLVERLDARFVLSAAGLRSGGEALGARAVVERTVTPNELGGLAPQSFATPSPGPDDLAFLQLTSGSTGLPRAVQISHRSALHNAHACDVSIGAPHGGPAHTVSDAMVSWLPLHHDMGLIGCFFQSLLGGLDLWLLPPEAFLARPRAWLENLGKRGTTFAPAPNFGYQLCVERLADDGLEGLDLSSWQDALTGAEMVRPETVDAFCERFASSGFRRQVFRPCYGLAEATLAVTVDLRGEGPRTRALPAGVAEDVTDSYGLRQVVSLGEPVADTRIRIVGPDGGELPTGRVGQVWVSGPGVFGGYYNDPEATAEILRDGWLATGDLGFLADGELYLTGRSKDVLIVRGHNLMPHELEWIAESVTGGGGALRTGAFSIARGAEGEEVVLVVETQERDPATRARIEGEIRRRIGRTLSLPVADLVFVRRGQIPKTTSGKVQRRALRAQYVAQEIRRLE